MLREFFWDYDFSALSWETDRDLITARTLAEGSWVAVRWLRTHIDDAALRDWIIARNGAGLDPQQLRFWEVKLDLPRKLVNAWLRDPARRVWDERTKR